MRPKIWATLALFAPAAASALSPREIYKQAAGAVVLLLGSDDGRSGTGGTGAVVTAEGLVVTNAHVVLGDSQRPLKTLYAFLKPDVVSGDSGRDLGRRYRASVVAFSPPEALDLALVRLEGAPTPLTALAFADATKVAVGDEVVAIGHPEQGGLWTLTTGAISTVIANYGGVAGKDVFQTEASVNRGNSGGPLIDADAHMVGINTLIARQAADGVAITAVNFSLKSSVALPWLVAQGVPLTYAGASNAAPPPAGAAAGPAPPPQGPAAGALKPAPEQVVAGQRLDVARAQPRMLTEVRPFDLDALRRSQLRELEGLMQEMRRFGRPMGPRLRQPGDGMGLW